MLVWRSHRTISRERTSRSDQALIRRFTHDILAFVETRLSLAFLETVGKADREPEVRQFAQEAVEILSPFVDQADLQ